MPGETEEKSIAAAALWPDQPPQFSKIPISDRLLVPLGGESGRAQTTTGTAVRRAQVLLQHASESSHFPVAPADGILGEVRPVRLTTGRPASAVELIVDHHETPHDLGEFDDSETRESGLVRWIERLRRAGVWADRHASPHLIAQLNHAVSRPIDTIVCTALDSDVSLRLNGAIAARFGDLVAEATALLARITGARRSVLAVEADAKPPWAAPWTVAARAANIEIVELSNDYPQSDPTLMVYSLTGRRLRPGRLPTTQGVLIVDAAAAWAVGQAARAKPMLTCLVAVHNHLRRRSHFLEVAIGTPLEDILKNLSIQDEGLIFRGGDLLRDQRLRSDAVIAGGELAIHVTGSERPVIPEPCIRCAWCVEACPTLLNPASVLEAAQRRDAHLAERAGLAACIECGICSHVCPSQLPLLSAVREVRQW